MVITHVKVDVDYENVSYTKKYYEDAALSNLAYHYPALEEICDKCGTYDKQADMMREKYHARIVNAKPIVLDSDDEWRFAVAYDIEWDGIKEELG